MVSVRLLLLVFPCLRSEMLRCNRLQTVLRRAFSLVLPTATRPEDALYYSPGIPSLLPHHFNGLRFTFPAQRDEAMFATRRLQEQHVKTRLQDWALVSRHAHSLVNIPSESELKRALRHIEATQPFKIRQKIYTRVLDSLRALERDYSASQFGKMIQPWLASAIVERLDDAVCCDRNIRVVTPLIEETTITGEVPIEVDAFRFRLNATQLQEFGSDNREHLKLMLSAKGTTVEESSDHIAITSSLDDHEERDARPGVLVTNREDLIRHFAPPAFDNELGERAYRRLGASFDGLVDMILHPIDSYKSFCFVLQHTTLQPPLYDLRLWNYAIVTFLSVSLFLCSRLGFFATVDWDLPRHFLLGTGSQRRKWGSALTSLCIIFGNRSLEIVCKFAPIGLNRLWHRQCHY